jgi:hypothetical protein
VQDVIGGQIVLLLKAGMRNSGHDGELLVGIGQPGRNSSSNPAMPSNSPRMTIVGTVMAAGSIHRVFTLTMRFHHRSVRSFV